MFIALFRAFNVQILQQQRLISYFVFQMEHTNWRCHRSNPRATSAQREAPQLQDSRSGWRKGVPSLGLEKTPSFCLDIHTPPTHTIYVVVTVFPHVTDTWVENAIPRACVKERFSIHTKVQKIISVTLFDEFVMLVIGPVECNPRTSCNMKKMPESFIKLTVVTVVVAMMLKMKNQWDNNDHCKNKIMFEAWANTNYHCLLPVIIARPHPNQMKQHIHRHTGCFFHHILWRNWWAPRSKWLDPSLSSSE